MAEVQWTAQQRNAIEGCGGNILVSAAAGSGKTAVLAQRVLHHITQRQPPVDVDRLLIVTFTTAAAGEMKQRISRKLWELAQQRPGDRWLMRQQLLLDSAQISTIHAFCIQLLRAHFHLLELPADFRIADEKQLELLQRETVREVIATGYETQSGVFLDLVELLASSRDDRRMDEAILKLYGFVRNHPFYQEWLDRVADSYRADLPLEQSPWFAILWDYAADALSHCHDLLTGALAQMDEQMGAGYQQTFAAELNQIDRCSLAMETQGWDTLKTMVDGIAFGRLGALRDYPDAARKETVQGLRSQVKDLVATLQSRVFLLTADQYRQDMELLSPVVRQLFTLVTDFDKALSRRKLEKKLLDFGDLEHYALRLLYDSEGGVHTPSKIACKLRGQYHEILIDEYQDTNGTQEMIFRALEQEAGNRFLVGDVKQSIYRFRQARPENFLEKKADYSSYDGSRYPAKIALSANFRTRQETTELINFIFRLTMSKKVGEMDYLPEDELFAQGDYDYTQAVPVQLLVADPALQGEAEEAVTQAAMVAAEIRRLLDDGTQVQGRDGMRPLAPSDICILLRSRTKADSYVQALDQVGLRCWSDRQEGFLATREIAPIISYLKLLANPLLELELSQLLCSFLYGFTTEMLARLRLSPEKNLFAALLQQAENDPACAAFKADFDLLRREAVSRSAAQVLQLLYGLTGAEHRALAMTQGEARRANLRLLCEYAAAYDGGTDLSGFLSYLYALEEYQSDLPSATVAAGNAVSVMTVHKSKGLEFPVVFLCETASKFNERDLYADLLLHPELGFACVVRDNRTMTQHRTLPLLALSIENRRAMLSEELRVLYVALTRARERLYIAACDKKLARLTRAAQTPLHDGRLTPWAARSAGCYLDWLAAALCRHPHFPDDLLDCTIQKLPIQEGQGGLAVRLVLPTPVTPKVSQADSDSPKDQQADPLPIDREEVRQLQARMHWEYPYTEDITTPVKLSVSQLTKEGEQLRHLFARRPKLLTQKSLTPAERGIAAHKFMQFADFAAAAADPEAEVRRLAQRGFLTPQEGDFVDVDALRCFFQSDIGGRVLHADKVFREIRFMQELTPQQLHSVSPHLALEQSTVVQGVADCVLLEQGRGTIIDYKTDLVHDPAELVRRYEGQLRLYQYILEQQLEITIQERVIWSFAMGKEILL